MSKEGPYSAPAPYAAFRDNMLPAPRRATSLLRRAKGDGIEVLGYGASTKGNVILQFCGLTEMDIPCIGEVNPDKFGCFTPGTLIPIIPEAEAKSRKPGAFLVLPWHFRDFILKKETDYRRSGGSCFSLFRAQRSFDLRKALVIGCDGQDGHLLTKSLEKDGWGWWEWPANPCAEPSLRRRRSTSATPPPSRRS